MRLLRTFVELYWRNEVGLRAAGISFFIFFALFPLLTTFISIAVTLPFLKVEIDQVQRFLTGWLLPDVIHDVQDYLREFVAHAGVLTAVGIAVSAWMLVKISFFLEKTLNRIWSVDAKSTFGRLLKKATLCWLLLTLVASAGTAASGHGIWSVAIEVLGTWMLFFVFNKSLPDRPITWKQALPGALVGGSAWYVTKWAFTTYVLSMAKANQIYAVLGIVPLLLLWLFATVLILLASACLNVAVSSGTRPIRGLTLVNHKTDISASERRRPGSSATH